MADFKEVLYESLLGRLAYALNLKYRPHKYDFGLSYYYRDFPEDIIEFMEDLVFIGNLSDLKIKKDKAIKKFYEVMNELENRYT